MRGIFFKKGKNFRSVLVIKISVFKPDPRLISQVLIESSMSILFFFINQNDIILVKNKKNSQRVAIKFFTGFC